MAGLKIHRFCLSPQFKTKTWLWLHQKLRCSQFNNFISINSFEIFIPICLQLFSWDLDNWYRGGRPQVLKLLCGQNKVAGFSFFNYHWVWYYAPKLAILGFQRIYLNIKKIGEPFWNSYLFQKQKRIVHFALLSNDPIL